MGPVLAVSLLWLAQAAIEIAGGAGCPDPAAVSRSLTSLLPAVSGGAPAAPLPSVRLSRSSAAELEILLLAPDGSRLDEKHLAAVSASSCDDLAAAVAVVVATWVSQPDVSLPERVELPGPAPAGERSAGGDPSLVVGAPGRPSSTSNLRLGAVASSAGAQWAAGLRAGGGIVLWGERWGLGAVAAATMPRSESVGSVPGAARWTRGYLGIGPEVTMLSGPVTLRAHVQGLMGLLHLTGSGVEMATSETALRFGTSGGLWSAWRGWGGVWPWMGVDLLFWPGRERLRVEGLAMEGTVPALEGQIAAGLGMDLFP